MIMRTVQKIPLDMITKHLEQYQPDVDAWIHAFKFNSKRIHNNFVSRVIDNVLCIENNSHHPLIPQEIRFMFTRELVKLWCF